MSLAELLRLDGALPLDGLLARLRIYISQLGPEEAMELHAELGRLRDACVPRMFHIEELPDRNLTVKEAARKLGICESNLYKMVKAKTLPFAVRVGGRLLFSERGIERWNRRMMGL